MINKFAAATGDNNPLHLDDVALKLTATEFRLLHFLASHPGRLLTKDEMGKILDEVRKVNPQTSFPTILIGDKVIVGYRELEILEALGL